MNLMLELHEGPDDYCILFDVHDDLVTLNHSVAPTAARFLQVKTKTTGTWTADALVKCKKSEKAGGDPLPSFLGKLYNHRIKFDVNVERLSFVSNVRYDVTMADDTSGKERESIRVSDLRADDIKTISDGLTAEHKLTAPPVGLDSTYLETTPLSLTDHEKHSIGVVATFLQKQGDGTIPPAPFHKTLKADIQRRTNREGKLTTFSDLVKYRGLTRKQVQEMIDSVMSHRKQDDLVALVTDQITKESFDSRRRLALVANVRKYLAHRLDPTNRILGDARRKIEDELRDIPSTAFTSPTVIADTISRLSKFNYKEWQAVRTNYSDEFLNAMIVVQIYEQELPPVGPQPEEENG
jgi:Cap4 dsDNA endonuclease